MGRKVTAVTQSAGLSQADVVEWTMPENATSYEASKSPGLACVTGEISSFENLVNDHTDALVWFAFRRLRNQTDAEEVVQDVFIRLFNRRGALGQISQIRPYLYRMVANACTDVLRRRSRAKMIEADPARLEQLQDHRSSAFAQAAAHQEMTRIHQFLDRLPRRQAEVIELHVMDDLPLSEIAELLGCPVPTVKSRFRYGIDKLRRLMKPGKEKAL